jgi:hypothetical protein
VGAVPTPPPPGGGKPPAGPPPLLWVKGGAADGNALPPLTRSMLERVLPPLVSRLQLDDDKDTVAAASEAIADVAKLVGPPAVAARGAALAQVLTPPVLTTDLPLALRLTVCHLLLALLLTRLTTHLLRTYYRWSCSSCSRRTPARLRGARPTSWGSMTRRTMTRRCGRRCRSCSLRCPR